MKKAQEEDLKSVLKFYLQIQSALHTLDEISQAPDFVREKKKLYNRMLNDIEKDLRGVVNVSDMKEKQFWIDCVQQLDNSASSLQIEISL